jgi:hypothetical protein
MLTVPAITAVLVLVALSALANDAAPPSGSRHSGCFVTIAGRRHESPVAVRNGLRRVNVRLLSCC